ncbi:hypothetical protein ACFX2H_013147 [Malus domestica]
MAVVARLLDRAEFLNRWSNDGFSKSGVSSGRFEGVGVRFEGCAGGAFCGVQVRCGGGQQGPANLLEDVDHWDYVHLPIFRVEDENGLVQKGKLAGGRWGF